MFELRIDLRDAGGRWRRDKASYVSGRSTIDVYRHPNIEHLMCRDEDRTLIVVRERGTESLTAGGQEHGCRHLREPTERWPLDYAIIALSPGEVNITAGPLGIAPVYLTIAADGSLRASWEFATVAQATTRATLRLSEVMRLLTYWYRYSTHTIVEEVRHLTERAAARFDARGLHMSYPAAAMHTVPRELREGAEPTAGLDTLLSAVVTARGFSPATVGIELSGGMDSAAVAATLGDLYPDAITCGGMLIPGPAGVQQRGRRLVMRKHMRLGADLTVDAIDHPPWHSCGSRASGAMVSPVESTYTEAQGALLGLLKATGVRTVFTGLGGDEMLSRRPWEVDRGPDWHRRHPDWLTPLGLETLEAAEADIAPASVVYEATLMSFASVAPLYLRRGMWPISPFADPRMITFGEWLPLEWRHRKRLLRDRLVARGLPSEVAHPTLRESLADVMSAGLMRRGLDVVEELSGDSRLVDIGLVDGDALRAVCRRIRDAGGADESDHQLFHFAAVELFLRS